MKTSRNAVALVAAAILILAGRADAHDESIAGSDANPTIVLHAVNYAALSPDVLDAAKARVARIYAVIGVRIVWVDGEVSSAQRQDGRLHLTIVLLSPDMAVRKISADHIKDGVLAQAHVTGRRASIFCDRIATAAGARKHFAIPLGDVMAHEVGHLVLGSNSHSPSGIMRPHMDVQAFILRSFNTTQATTIRTSLVGLAMATTPRLTSLDEAASVFLSRQQALFVAPENLVPGTSDDVVHAVAQDPR